MKGSQVSIQNVHKQFGDFVALDNIDFTIKQGEFFTLLGPSGCGKTTLLRILAGFEFPDDGAVLFDDIDVTELPLDKSIIDRKLVSGNVVICIMGPGKFTTGGHFIVIAGIENGKYRINDPNSYTNSNKLWEYDEISDQIKNLWSLSAR